MLHPSISQKKNITAGVLLQDTVSKWSELEKKLAKFMIFKCLPQASLMLFYHLFLAVAKVAGIEKRLFEGESEKVKVPKYSLNDLDNDTVQVCYSYF